LFSGKPSACPRFFTGAKIACTSCKSASSSGSASHSAQRRILFRIRAAGHGRGDLRIRAGKLQRELRDIAPAVCTKFRCLARRGFHLFGLFQPGWQRRIGEQTRGERAGIHRADAACLQLRHKLIGEARILQRVLIVAQHAIQLRLPEHVFERLHRITGDADETHFPGLLLPAQSGQSFIHNLLQRHEFDVVAEHDIEVIRAEPMQRDIHAFGDALCGKVEVREIVAAELRAKRVALPRHALEHHAEQHLAHPAAVEGRGVDEVQPEVERDADAGEHFIQRDGAELRAERRGAEAQDGNLEASAAERAGRDWSIHHGLGRADEACGRRDFPSRFYRLVPIRGEVNNRTPIARAREL
jgi:hypothetical protein